jgi:hypothetical protein
VNTDHIWNFTTTILTARTRPTRFAPLSQGCEQLGTQLTARHRIERRVNGFVAGTHRGVIWEHAWKYARNLFRRISLPKQLLNLRPQKAVFSQASRLAASGAIQSSTLVGSWRTVSSCHSGATGTSGLGSWVTPSVKRKLATNGAGAAIQAQCDSSHGATSLKAQLNQRPLFAIKMFVFGIHRNTVPQG